MDPSRPITDRVSPELIELVFDSASDGLFAVDADMRITVFNRTAERILGLPRSEVIGRPCHEVLRSDHCRESCARFRAPGNGEAPVDLIAEVTDIHGRRIPVSLSCSSLTNERGEFVGGVGTFRNMNTVRKLLKTAERRHPFADIVTDDAHMQHIFEILPTIASSDSAVLVYGETGTGKSLIARAIHNLSNRRRGPLVVVNCGALPETLLESEIFGHTAGAYTGAIRNRKGRIAAAEGGTLFLDEIGDMPMSMQVKLLRFLQDHVYERLGDVRPIKADVRVLAATNRNLGRLIAEGAFRQDLYYRINVMSIELPPLRERRRDIPLLVQEFLDRLSMSRGKLLTGVSAPVLELLMAHDYPGNVRELENIVEHAFVLCPGPTIEMEHLPVHFQPGARPARSTPARTMQEVERRLLLDVLERNRWNRRLAAKELGVHKTTLLRRIKRLGLRLPKQDGRTTRHRKK